MAHPFHVHGHTFWVLGLSEDVVSNELNLNTVNPVARDTINVPGSGMVKIRIHFDNRKFNSPLIFFMLILKLSSIQIANDSLFRCTYQLDRGSFIATLIFTCSRGWP